MCLVLVVENLVTKSLSHEECAAHMRQEKKLLQRRLRQLVNDVIICYFSTSGNVYVLVSF